MNRQRREKCTPRAQGRIKIIMARGAYKRHPRVFLYMVFTPIPCPPFYLGVGEVQGAGGKRDGNVPRIGATALTSRVDIENFTSQFYPSAPQCRVDIKNFIASSVHPHTFSRKK